MSVPVQTPSKEYIANGTTTAFPLEFNCDKAEYLIVTLNGEEAPVGSWTLANDTVTFNVAPLNGVVVNLQRNTPFQRTTNYQLYDNSFRPSAVNKDFDLIWWKLQELGYRDQVIWLALVKEISDRIDGDEDLQNQINTIDEWLANLQQNVNENTNDIAQLVNDLSKEIADRIKGDQILKDMFLSMIDEAINEGTINALAITHLDSLEELEGISNLWDGRTIYVKDLGNYRYDAFTTSWVKAYQDASNVIDGALTQHEINSNIKEEIDKYKDRIKDVFYAVDFGLKTTNTAYQNTIALQQLSTAVNNNNGGRVVLPRGEYLIGHQTLAGAEDKGGSWLYSEYLNINGCTNPVLIEADQTILKFKDGMRHGAFDPITGEVVANGGQIKKYDAGYGRAISITNNEDVLINGQLRVNGNDANAIVGGTWGDSGRQCVSYGIYATGNKVLKTYGTFVLHNLPLDGLYVASLNQADSLTDINGVISLKNARQALSLTGGWNQTYSNCYFGKTGMGNFPYSAPAANVDLEAEITGQIKNITFFRSIFSDAMGGSVISEFMSVIDVRFELCLIENSQNVSIYCKSNLEFYECDINGKVEPFYSKFEEKPAKMIRCNVSQFMSDGSLAYIQGALFSDGGTSADGSNNGIPNATFSSLDTVDFNYDFNNANNAILCYLASRGRSRNLTFTVSGNPALITTAELIQLSGTMSIDGFMLNDKSQYVGGLPNQRKGVVGSGLQYVKNAFITKNQNGDENILWRDTYYSAGGRTGWYAGASIDRQGEQLEAKELSILKNRYGTQSYYDGGQVLSSSNSIPASGWYRYGTIIFNASPSIGQPMGWICTKEGTAGADAVFAKLPNIVAIS